jgi:hypothetical protein
MRLHEHGIEALTANKQVIDLAKWGISDEQIRGACEIAKKRNALSFGYVYGVLKNEHERNNKPPPMPEPVEIDVPVRAKEEWERQGFASQADYEACDHAFTKAKFRNTRLTWVEHKEQWKGVM